MRDRRERSAAGFTLLELLVVVGIIGLVMAIGTSTFYSVMSAWNERRAIAELDAQADLALDSIRLDIADTLAFEMSGVAIRGETHLVEDTRTYPPAQHRDDRLLVPVRALDAQRPLIVPASVGYRVERMDASGRLVRTVGPLSAEFPDTNRIDVIPNANVLGFSVEYLAAEPDTLWVSEWTHEGMPAAIRISLALEHMSRPNQFQVTRHMVFPVHVQ